MRVAPVIIGNETPVSLAFPGYVGIALARNPLDPGLPATGLREVSDGDRFDVAEADGDALAEGVLDLGDGVGVEE